VFEGIKFMLRSEIKEILLLLIFACLLRDVLTVTTIGFVFLGAVLIWFKIRPSKFIRNAMALGIFASYWLTYGKVIDPIIGLNFLTTIIVLKQLEKDSKRDQYMIFFGLLLIISSGSLFERSLTYVFFFGASFFILIQDFYKGLGIRSSLKSIRNGLLWVLPLTVLMFFFVPRLFNPLPYQSGTPSQGEVGYTPNVNIEDVETLSSNDKPVFQVLVSKKINQEDLYWRGNTLFTTDGWNWMNFTQDPRHVKEVFAKEFVPVPEEIHQKIRSFYREEFFFTLDRPNSIFAGNSFYHLSGSKTLPQNRWHWSQRYQASSLPGNGFEALEKSNRYLSTPLKQSDRLWIEEHFKGTTVAEIKAELKRYFYEAGFQYSLSPGRITSFRQFIQSSKIGYCSHYSSALALILRTKKIPARLVSGFMGGVFNRFSEAYLVSQNDAHVWVEAMEDNQWTRLDPTEWIAPDRVLLGGEAFVSKVSQSRFEGLRIFTARLGWWQDFQQWFSQWDFKFYLWLEDMDYYGQEAFFSRLKFKREWLISFAPLLMALFMGLYTWHLSRQKRKAISEHEELWLSFLEKSRQRGLNISAISITEDGEALKNFNHRDKDQLFSVWKNIVKASFEENSDLKEIRRQIKQL
jgi:hypothetical protein